MVARQGPRSVPLVLDRRVAAKVVYFEATQRLCRWHYTLG